MALPRGNSTTLPVCVLGRETIKRGFFVISANLTRPTVQGDFSLTSYLFPLSFMAENREQPGSQQGRGNQQGQGSTGGQQSGQQGSNAGSDRSSGNM